MRNSRRGVVAQSPQPTLSATSAAATGVAVSKHCASVEKQYQALKQGSAKTATSNLVSLEERGESCLDDVFAQLSPERRSAAKAAFKLYQAVNSELVSKMRQRDAAEARALSDRETPDGGHRLASLFGQYAELSYRYDEVLDEVQKYMRADDKFHQSMAATAPASTLPPSPIMLPGKVEFLNCADYRVGDSRLAGRRTTTKHLARRVVL